MNYSNIEYDYFSNISRIDWKCILKGWKILKSLHFGIYLTIVCTHGKNKILGSGMLLSVTTEIFIHTKIDIILWFTYHISWKVA